MYGCGEQEAVSYNYVYNYINNILRRILRLPARTHTAILDSVAGLQSMYNVAAQRSKSLLILAPLTLFNLYLVTLSPLAILFLGSTLCMVHDTLNLMQIKIKFVLILFAMFGSQA